MDVDLGTARRISRRSLLRAGASMAVGTYALGSAGFLSACSSSDEDSGTGPIRVIVPEGGLSRAFTEAARTFEQTGDGSVEILTYPYAEARQQQLLELAGGSGGVDAVLIDGEIWLAELHQFLEPVDDRMAAGALDRFIPSMPPMFVHDGASYALPFRVGGWVLIYRTDLFEAAGIEVPETWDDFRAAAEALTGGDTFGFAAPFAQSNYLVAQWIPFLWSFGGEILTPDNSAAAWNTDAGRAATEFLVSLYEDGLVPPGAIEADNDGVITAMQQGQAAMSITYSPYFLEMNDPAKSDLAGNFDVAGRLPYQAGSGLSTGRSLLAGWGVGIARGSARKDAVWALIEYLSSDEVQLELAVSHGNSPTATAVYTDQSYQDVYSAASEVRDVLESASTRPAVVEWSRIEETLALRLSEAMTGRLTVADALAAAESDVNSLLSE